MSGLQLPGAVRGDQSLPRRRGGEAGAQSAAAAERAERSAGQAAARAPPAGRGGPVRALGADHRRGPRRQRRQQALDRALIKQVELDTEPTARAEEAEELALRLANFSTGRVRARSYAGIRRWQAGRARRGLCRLNETFMLRG